MQARGLASVQLRIFLRQRRKSDFPSWEPFDAPLRCDAPPISGHGPLNSDDATHRRLSRLRFQNSRRHFQHARLSSTATHPGRNFDTRAFHAYDTIGTRCKGYHRASQRDAHTSAQPPTGLPRSLISSSTYMHAHPQHTSANGAPAAGPIFNFTVLIDIDPRAAQRKLN